MSMVRRARYLLRAYAGEHPAIYLPFARRKYPGPSPQVVGCDTELVIDGFTRCATTFAVYGVQLAQREPVRVAHHLHAPAQLIDAARRGIPTLLVIREPRGAILSHLIREPRVALRDALVAYSRFYECVAPYLSRFVVGDFDTVTGDFGSVIRRLNARFGTSLTEFVHTEANMRECFALIERRGAGSQLVLRFESGQVAKGVVRREAEFWPRPAHPVEAFDAWIPSTGRHQAKEGLAPLWLRPDLTRLRERAESAYQVIVAGARPEVTGMEREAS
jgi:hypothetical protein